MSRAGVVSMLYCLCLKDDLRGSNDFVGCLIHDFPCHFLSLPMMLLSKAFVIAEILSLWYISWRQYPLLPDH